MNYVCLVCGIKKKLMRRLLLILFISPLIVIGQKADTSIIKPLPKHYFAVNPLNIFLFQQVGLTYEFKPNRFGYGITAGYIYPNYKPYSNYFIAGPTRVASLGDYSGFFIVPHVNIFLSKPKNKHCNNLVYVSFKFVYKYMHIDSTRITEWEHHGNGYYAFRKMIDNVNIYGGFVDFGYRFVLYHFFFDINVGGGFLSVNHNMLISGETGDSFRPIPMLYHHPPRKEEYHKINATINFTINIGLAF